MEPFARDLDYDGPPFPWDEDRRALLRAELDAWYARAYGLTRDELRYILDPADVKGSNYPSETFRVLKNNEKARFGEYRTARLVLQAWDRLERGKIADVSPPAAAVTPAGLPSITPLDQNTMLDGAWARPDGVLTDNTVATQLAALLRALPGPAPTSRIRLAALYALEPRYLTRHLKGKDRTTWLRLVGKEAEPVKGANVVALTPKVNRNWGLAVSQLRGMHALDEDAAAQTWSAGSRITEYDIDAAEWPYGRAVFVLKAMEGMNVDDAIAGLAAEDQTWIRAYAG
jgi:hypothetical protein